MLENETFEPENNEPLNRNEQTNEPTEEFSNFPEATETEPVEVEAVEADAPEEPAKEEPKAYDPDPGYEYIFSDGANDLGKSVKAKTKTKKTSRKGFGAFVAVICVAVAACILLSFFAGLAGYKFLNNDKDLSDASENGSALTPNSKSNATVVLEKVERTGSEYGSAGEDVFSTSQVVKLVHDAVVVIQATVQTYDYFGRVSSGTSAGSGVIISSDGYILTCNHVVSGASAVTVQLNDGTKYDASLVGTDSTSDLAVLKINASDLTYVKQGCSADLVPGERVIAIGNPLGTLGGSVTSGIISATERNITTEDGKVMTLIQTDTAINSGNSGGGLFNMRGELVGIVNAKYADSGIEGLAFAIPVDSAFLVEQDLIQYGYVRGVIDDGLSTIDITASNLASYRWYYGINTIGLYVVSSKYCKDLANGDRIVSINGKEVNTTDEWNAYLKDNCKVGDTVTVVAERDGKAFTTTLTLQEYVPDSALK